MSETKKTLSKLSALPCFWVLASLGAMSPLALAQAEGIPGYGAQMCESAGIPMNECTLTGGPWPTDDGLETSTEVGKRGKAETLVGHATTRCEHQGIAPEDCQALPPTQRGDGQAALPASPFLTVPASLPPVAIAPSPEAVSPPVVVSPPRPVRREAVRIVSPPRAPSTQPVFGEVRPSPLAVQPPFRDVGPPAAVSAFRDVGPPPPAFRPVFRDVGPSSVQPPFREVVPSAEPVVRERRGLPVIDAQGARAFREPRGPIRPVFREGRRPIGDDDDVGLFDRLFDGRQSRCRREVRYSRPPSYRYVECF